MKNIYTVLTEASGSLTSGYLIKAIKEAGGISVASDVDEQCWAKDFADKFLLMPYSNDSNLWSKTKHLLLKNNVDIVIPSLDETLEGWSTRVEDFFDLGVKVIISEHKTIKICQDKWLTYQFFKDCSIPTPKSSLQQLYPLVKPRLGRGGSGVRVTDEPIEMDGLISQELLTGEEFTVDIFCDANHYPIYIIPRKRLNVRDGKSTAGTVEEIPLISFWVKKICSLLNFVGPINVQCFIDTSGQVKFTEINPRVGGGMALAFAASENWINLIINNLILSNEINPKPIKYGMQMKRYYAEIFIPSN